MDGKEVDSKTMPGTIPFLVSFEESFDVGVDTRRGMDDDDYQPPFRFTGKLDKLTITLEEMTAAEEKLLAAGAQGVEGGAMIQQVKARTVCDEAAF